MNTRRNRCSASSGISDFDADVRTLSGGQKKRIALAAALIRPVDLLLLDEPTNHIDAETIALLESRLTKYRGTLMMVTHDRYFLDRVCNRIAEISEGELYLHDGNFSYYLEQKAARLEMENAAARKRSSDPAAGAGMDQAGRAGQKHQAKSAHPAL